MRTDGLTLILPEKGDLERDAVARAWERRGGDVLRLGRFWDPPALNPQRVRLYGSDAFCLVLEQKLGLALVSPADDLLLRLPHRCLRRAVARRPLEAVLRGDLPAFVKPLTPKLFRARVYHARAALEEECIGLPRETEVLTSEVVTFAAEARCVVLADAVLECAVYEGDADVTDAHAAAQHIVGIVGSVGGPRTYVMDLGLIPGAGWAVVEFNATWGAGLNGCDPDRVLPAIAAATAPAVAATGDVANCGGANRRSSGQGEGEG